jgi:hypothetical protein
MWSEDYDPENGSAEQYAALIGSSRGPGIPRTVVPTTDTHVLFRVLNLNRVHCYNFTLNRR